MGNACSGTKHGPMHRAGSNVNPPDMDGAKPSSNNEAGQKKDNGIWEAKPVGLMENLAAIHVFDEVETFRQTGIVCTIGPKTNNVEMLTALRRAGMNIVRMNFSHGSHEFHASVIANVRKSVELVPDAGRAVAIAIDTKGPEIRTGNVEGGGEVQLKLGDKLTVSTDEAFKDKCSDKLVFVDYANLTEVISVNSIIYIDDGLLSLKVLSIDDSKTLTTLVQNAGVLSSRKGVNLPNIDVDLPALSDKDKADLRFGVEQGVDMVFASFIRKASDVDEVRECLGEEGSQIRIISKIENHEGVRNFDEILAATDGVMVARGDLGIEIEPEKVFLAQKMIIAKCNIAGKPVICATQMLESMTYNPRPTRAEASDVANAILDGADCVMLSGETAKGNFPVEAVQMMDRVAREAEAAFFSHLMFEDLSAQLSGTISAAETVALSACLTTMHEKCAAIITLTNTGESIRLLAKFRPSCPIVVVSRQARTCRVAHLYRGCYPLLYPKMEKTTPWQKDVEERLAWAMETGKEHGFLSEGSLVVVVHGKKLGDTHLSLSDFHVRVV